MKRIQFQQHLLPHLIAYIVFLTTVISFFNPVFFQKKKLFQGDIPHHEGISQQTSAYRAATGKEALWNNRVFSGMPAYLLDVHYQEPLTHAIKALIGGYLPSNISYIFIAMLMAYVLLLSFGVNPFIAIAGGLAYGLSTFTLISIGLGHDGKVDAMAWMPLVLAGVHLAYHSHRWWGASLTAVGLMLEIAATHPQINYYLALILLCYGINQLIIAISKKQLRVFIATSGALLLAVSLAIGTNVGRLWTIYEYGKYSIRGQSELTDANQSASSGLDKAYAFAWSLGKLETLTLLLPNFYGGSSHESLSQQSHVAAALKKRAVPVHQIQEFLQGMPAYWGDQPFTGGPMYLGIIICFLCVSGCWLVSSTNRYWLLACIVLAIILSWGKNWSAFNVWMYAYFPGYNKFRAVTTAIVMAQLATVLMAGLTLQQLLKTGLTPLVKRSLLYTSVIMGSVLLLSLDLGDWRTYRGAVDQTLPVWLAHALQADRKLMVQQDVFRCGLLIALLCLLLGAYYKKRLYAYQVSIGIIGLIWADYYFVGKRYIKDNSYQTQATINKIDHTPAKAFIEQDKTLGYRVLNLHNPFNDGRTSYYFQSVGGYHGAKLRRYQDLIAYHLNDECGRIVDYLRNDKDSLEKLPVLNMLNTKYFMHAPQTDSVITNPHALGNAWFVKAIQPVSSAAEEINALKWVDLAHTAVIDTSQFVRPVTHLGQGRIVLKQYEPNELRYETTTDIGGLAVFSELYYPVGWKAYVDNQPTDIIRVNYVLRALVIPAGKHNIHFKFAPLSYHWGNKIMLISSFMLVVLLFVGAFYPIRCRFTRNV